MEAKDIYQKLVYRDILAYALPGALLTASLWMALTPLTIGNYQIIPPNSASISNLAVMLVVGFILAHLISVLPRGFLQTGKKWFQAAEAAFSHGRVVCLEPWLKEAFEHIFGEDSWKQLDVFQKRECIWQWINAHDMETDRYNRIGAVRLFCENVTFIIPLSILILASRATIADMPRSMSILLLIILAIGCALLSYRGQFQVQVLENREAIFIFIQHYFRNKELFLATSFSQPITTNEPPKRIAD